MDNSGHGPLRVPGFGGLSIEHHLPADARFAHGFREWRQSPIVTAQELAMVAVMDRLTDKPTWTEDVFDDAIVAQWRAELERERFLANPRLMQGKAWEWCVRELRDKAVYYKEHHHIRVLGTGSCVCKADAAELQSIAAALRQAVVPLAHAYEANQVDRERLGWQEQMEKCEAELWELEADEYAVEVNALVKEEDEEYMRRIVEAQDAINNQQAVEDRDIVGQPDFLEDEADDDLSDDMLAFMTSDTMDGDEDEEERWDDSLDATDHCAWEWPSKEKPLDIAGSADMISALVDPLLYPLVYGKTLVLQNGGTVALDNVTASYEAAQVARRLRSIRHAAPDTFHPWSQLYQSLPCEVAFVNDNGNDVKITSYINGLHPSHTDMYLAIEKVLSRAIQPWNDCLVRGRRGMRDPCHLGQLGPVPARIVTYGVEWENELPEWAIAFRVPSKDRKGQYHEEKAKAEQLPENSRKRKREEDCLQSMFRDVIGKEGLKLPPLDSSLWELAREYLARPELVYGAGQAGRPFPVSNDNWEMGDERTWNFLVEKTSRLLSHKHPEPGTAFSYEEWKEGRHGSRPIVDKAVVMDPELRKNWAPPRSALLAPPHVPHSPIALQDQFRGQGLQVLVEVGSIDLTPERPAYAPDAATRMAANAAQTAKAFIRATAKNCPVELHGRPDDLDGWQLPGRMNEHIVATAVCAFDVDNVSEPRLAFRQRTSVDFRLHRFRECHAAPPPENASEYYDYREDGPAHLAHQLDDDSALAEVLDITTEHLGGSRVYRYQHIGSVATRLGRLVTFPGVLEHRTEPFRLVDATKPGRYRWLKLSLVDPHYRICSTRNVPAQQHNWWADEVSSELTAHGLPQEIINQIMRYTDSWPMGADEAQWHREQQVQEKLKSKEWLWDGPGFSYSPDRTMNYTISLP